MPENKMTMEQFGQTIKLKYPEYQSKSDSEVAEAVLSKYPEYKSSVQTGPEKRPTGVPVLGDIGGIGQSYLDAPRTFAESGVKLSDAFSKTKLGASLGQGVRDIASGLGLSPEKQREIGGAGTQIIQRGVEQPELTKPKTQAQARGNVIGDISQFLLPSGATAKVASTLSKTPQLARLGRFAGPVARGVTEGVAGTAIGVGQTGDLGQGAGIGATDAAITTGVGVVSPVAGRAIGAAARKVGDIIPSPRKVAETISSSPIFQGAKQIGEDLVGRIPRAAERVSEKLEKSAQKSERLRESSSAVRTAIEANVENRLIDSLIQADKPTIKSAKAMEGAISSEKPKLGVREKPPEVFSGRAAVRANAVIDKERRAIGVKIGEASRNLPKDQYISSDIPRRKATDALQEIGVVSVSPEGKLVWGATNITPKQRLKIQELFNLLPKHGQVMNPYEIHKMDQLFSSLQRESKRFDEILDILVPTANGEKQNIFQVLRNVFSETLDENTSSDIRLLNKEYQPLARLRDNLNRTIFKQTEEDTGVDLAQIAGKRLRRVFSDAQSQPEYSAIATNLVETARDLGYKGADPLALADFAESLRRLYPSTVPKTSFAGGIRLGVGGAVDLAEKVSKVGAPNIKDQQKALKALLESLQK